MSLWCVVCSRLVHVFLTAVQKKKKKKKGKKSKKETKEQKEKRLKKEQDKETKEKEREKNKQDKEVVGKGKKAGSHGFVPSKTSTICDTIRLIIYHNPTWVFNVLFFFGWSILQDPPFIFSGM